MAGATAPLVLHASAVAIGNRGCLITGASGSGKSTLALEMIASGARLVADDRTEVRRDRDALELAAPAAIAGLVEARGVGLIRLPHCTASLHLVVDLDEEPVERLPRRSAGGRHLDLLGIRCPVILGRNRTGLAAILSLALRHGLVDTG